MRLFVGISPGNTYKKKMEELLSGVRPLSPGRITWVRPENFHLTLYFIGEVPGDVGGRIREELRRVRYPCFELQGGGGGFFPSINRPRVLWVGCIKGAKQCHGLFEEVKGVVERVLSSHGHKDRFTPHLTLARIRGSAPLSTWKAILSMVNKTSWDPVVVDSFILWKSTLTPRGPIYTPLEKYELLSP